MALGGFQPDLGTITAPKHRLTFDNPALLDLMQWPAGSPWAPYQLEPIFYLLNHFGLRLFSMWQMPDSLTNLVQEDRATLLEVSGLDVAGAPLETRLMSSFQIAERPQVTLVLDNHDGYWDTLIGREAVLNMPAGLYVLVRRSGLVTMMVGTVGQIEFAEHRVQVTLGDFGRDPEEEA